MITPQDIRNKTFEKAVFGGYDMASVDSFLEELAGDLTLLQKENAVLKGKMKVLVDKVEEYRGNEDALRTAVLSAQRLGLMIEKESKEKAASILAEANAEAERITREANNEVALERTRLAESRNASAKFLDSMDLLCRRQLEFLQKIGDTEFVRDIRGGQDAAPAPENAEVHETVKSIEETVTKVPEEPSRPAPPVPLEDDDRPTRPFNVVTDLEDAAQNTSQFSLEGFQQ